MIKAILLAALVLGGMGVLFGIILGIASKVFHVDKDERVGMILQVLPCANCGGCGYAGCSAYAEAVVKGTASPSGCIVGGETCVSKVADIMGVQATTKEKKVARVKCGGNCFEAPAKYEYIGVQSCVSAARIAGGPKNCEYGCFGLGSCAKVCPADAISMSNGIAYVIESKCVACGLCVSTCPRRIIELVPASKEYTVVCNSKAKGAKVTKVCDVGCIGCKMCEKACPNGAITVEDNRAKIDYTKCTNCGLCSEKCPRKIIKKF
ncbi:MAG: Fe-S cluster domain-containing protein [Clostridia bacterium]|nr:Fe-S cluster domain-containing protein [Clostridia bacterium]